MLSLDGSFGEGGGQIIRTSLALSLITGRAFRVFNVRARRDKPGLQRQHMTAVTAAAAIGGAKVDGAHAGSKEFTFATPLGTIEDFDPLKATLMKKDGITAVDGSERTIKITWDTSKLDEAKVRGILSDVDHAAAP